HGVPIDGRNRRFTETRQIDQMHAMRVLEERSDPAQALAAAAPSVQKHQMMGRRLSTDFVDQAGSAVLEALDANESTSQAEGSSVSRRYSVPDRRRCIADGHGEAQLLVDRQKIPI